MLELAPSPDKTPEQDVMTAEADDLILDPYQIEVYKGRFGTDTLLIPSVYAKSGIKLSYRIERTLLGDGQEGDRNTTGFGRAAIEIGKVINKLSAPQDLFDRNTLTTTTHEDGWGVDYDLPNEEALLSAEASSVIGESGQLISRLVLDCCYPYEKQEGDGYVELNPRTDNHYKTSRYGSGSDSLAKLCSNTEEHFVHHGFSKFTSLKEILVGGEVVALQKSSGDHTAILIKPALLNGVRLPVGSIMITAQEGDDDPQFAFGRLSAFSLSTPEEAARTMPDLVRKEFNGTHGKRELADAISSFAERVGKVIDTPEIVFNSMFTEEYYSSSEELINADLRIVQELHDRIQDDAQLTHVAKWLDRIERLEERAAIATVSDKKHLRAADWDYSRDPHTREAARDRVIEQRKKLINMFGRDVVDIVKLLRDVSKIATSNAEQLKGHN